MSDRPDIPEELKRQVLIESRHGCAICGAETTELAHIVPWAKVKEHKLENLIALCPNHHTRFDKGQISTAAIREYKKKVQREYAKDPIPEGPTIKRGCIASFARQGQGFQCAVGLAVTLFAVLSGIGLPNYIKVKEKAKDAEVKADLHNIQLSIERFAVDNAGSYPDYLIGGSPRYAAAVDLTQRTAFQQIMTCEPDPNGQPAASDPLIRAGYVDEYPRNPFVRDGRNIHRLQVNLPTSRTGDDPLRNSTDGDAALLGTRFGPYNITMACVLADPRFTLWSRLSPSSQTSRQTNTWADIEYDSFDGRQSAYEQSYLLGQFFYKGSGPIIEHAGTDSALQPVTPEDIDQYMLGGFGGPKTKGKDILGPEAQVISKRMDSQTDNWLRQATAYAQDTGSSSEGRPGGPAAPTIGTQAKLWPWTRSVTKVDGRDGSPYSPAPTDTVEQLQYGNPNGLRDGVVLVLTAGEAYIGER